MRRKPCLTTGRDCGGEGSRAARAPAAGAARAPAAGTAMAPLVYLGACGGSCLQRDFANHIMAFAIRARRCARAVLRLAGYSPILERLTWINAASRGRRQDRYAAPDARAAEPEIYHE